MRRLSARRLLVLLGAAVVAVVLVQVGAAKPPSASIKLFDACLQVGGQPDCSTATKTGGTTSTLPGGAAAPVTLTVTNERGSNTTLGSIHVLVPGGVSIDPGNVVSTAGTVGGATTASLIEILNMGLSPGQSATVTFNTTQLPCSGGPYTWTVYAKQSNQFNGTGNDFAETLTTGLTSNLKQCYLQFDTEPANTDQGDVVQNGGKDVTVGAYDGSGALMTGASGTVSLSPSPTGSFTGTGPVSLSGGEATFSNLVGDTPGTYTLAASTTLTGVAGATSNSFTILAAGHLVFLHEPANAVVGKLVTDTAYNTAVDGTNVHYVAVEVKDANDSVVTSDAGQTVTLAETSGASFSNTTATFDSSGVATFTTLQGNTATPLNATYTLQATSGAYTAATSTPFVISLAGEPCTTSGCSSLTTTLDSNTQVTSSGTGTVFTFLGVNSGAPFTPTNLPTGCENLHPLGGAVVSETDGRTSDTGGTLTFVYAIKKQLVQASPNNGNPFIAICAGTQRVGADGTPIDCHVDSLGGWADDTLNSNGVFDGQNTAQCNPDGLWWGILATYQDPVDPSVNPTETAWQGGSQYRYFTITVPSPWDMQWGG